jgi:hypothetical protein
MLYRRIILHLKICLGDKIMKNILLIFAGLITIGNVALSNSDIFDIPLSHCNDEQHKIVIPEELSENFQPDTNLDFIYSILLKNDNSKLRSSENIEIIMFDDKQDSEIALIIFDEHLNSQIEIEK